jgi:hypothetical protein
MREHLKKMRLAATEEAAYPCALLTGLAGIREEGFDDALDAIGVLAFAHKARELTLELLDDLFVGPIGYPSLALVD